MKTKSEFRSLRSLHYSGTRINKELGCNDGGSLRCRYTPLSVVTVYGFLPTSLPPLMPYINALIIACIYP